MRRMFSEKQVAEIAKETIENGVNGEQVKLQLSNIVDADGNPRFIEGDIELKANIPSGFHKTYGKWSLSGTHLMIVLAGNIDNGTEVSGVLAEMGNIPQWITNKVSLLRPNENIVDQYQVVFYGGSTQNSTIYLEKSSTEILRLYLGSITVNADKSFRIVFDLLIDND